MRGLQVDQPHNCLLFSCLTLTTNFHVSTSLPTTSACWRTDLGARLSVQYEPQIRTLRPPSVASRTPFDRYEPTSCSGNLCRHFYLRHWCCSRRGQMEQMFSHQIPNIFWAVGIFFLKMQKLGLKNPTFWGNFGTKLKS